MHMYILKMCKVSLPLHIYICIYIYDYMYIYIYILCILFSNTLDFLVLVSMLTSLGSLFGQLGGKAGEALVLSFSRLVEMNIWSLYFRSAHW